MKSLNKYLNTYCEKLPELSKIQQIFQYGILIPTYSEGGLFLENLKHWLQLDHDALLVLIINEAFDSPAAAKKLNQHLIQQLFTLAESREVIDEYHSLIRLKNRSLMVVNRTGACALHQGVGEARKIGADLLLKLQQLGRIKSPWIFSSDADVRPPPNYFEVLEETPQEAVGLHFEFVHHSEPELAPGIMEYEYSLRHYASELAKAGSPYSFLSVGSCLAFRSEAYAMVRGFPKRKAGEDFYLFNKLRKLGSITHPAEPELQIQARAELRTPFGTSAALLDPQKSRVYQTQAFQKLSEFIDFFVRLCAHPQSPDLGATELLLPRELPVEEILDFWAELRARTELGPERIHQFWIWFDAFRQLRFLQAWSRQAFPKKCLEGHPGPHLAHIRKKRAWRPLAEISIRHYSLQLWKKYQYDLSLPPTPRASNT
jgi:hypothetical protein